MLYVKVPNGFLRFGGWALLIGGLMGFSGQLMHIGDTPERVADIAGFVGTAVNTHIWLAWASILILMGLPAIYLRQAGNLKVWGWMGFPLLFIGMILEIFHGPFQILAYPIIYSLVSTDEVLNTVNGMINNLMIDDYPLTLLVLIPQLPGIVFGLLLLGISTVRSGVFHKGLGIFTLVVLALLVVGRSIPEMNVFSAVHLIFVAYGAALAFEKKAAVSVEEKLAV